MKFAMLLVVFVILGLIGANAIIDYGLHFDSSNHASKIRPSGYEYLLIIGLTIFLFCLMSMYEVRSAPRTLGIGISIITVAAFWVCVRLGWTILSHGSLASTGNAGTIVIGQISGRGWIYFNLLANLLLFFVSLFTLSRLKQLGALTIVGLCAPIFLAWKWCWPLTLVAIVIATFLIVKVFSLGTRQYLKLMDISKTKR